MVQVWLSGYYKFCNNTIKSKKINKEMCVYVYNNNLYILTVKLKFDNNKYYIYIFIAGADLAERGAQETSSIVVETVQKISKSKQAGPVLPLFKSDASKISSKGMGLKKAYLGKQNQFTVSAGDAGMYILLTQFQVTKKVILTSYFRLSLTITNVLNRSQSLTNKGVHNNAVMSQLK